MLALRLAAPRPRAALALHAATTFAAGPARSAAVVGQTRLLFGADGRAAAPAAGGVFGTDFRAAAPVARGFASGPVEAGRQGRPAQAAETIVVYRGRGMQLFRALVRLKIFQLVGVVSGGWVLAALMATDASVSATQLAAASGLTAGAVGASLALWYYSRRYVGELALVTPAGATSPSLVRFSVLDFWGNRQNVEVPIDQVIPPCPPGTPRSALGAPLVPLQALGDRQYFVSLRYGRVADPEKLKWLLTRDLVQ